MFDRRVTAWLAADVDAYMDCWHEDMQLTLPGGRVVSGVDAYRRMVEQSFAWADTRLLRRPRARDNHGSLRSDRSAFGAQDSAASAR